MRGIVKGITFTISKGSNDADHKKNTITMTTFRKSTLNTKLDKFNSLSGKRDSDAKRKADRGALDYLRTHFEEVKSDSFPSWEKSDYRYVLHETTVPANQRGNLAKYAGKKVQIVFFSKDRNGRQTAFIRCKYAKDCVGA